MPLGQGGQESWNPFCFVHGLLPFLSAQDVLGVSPPLLPSRPYETGSPPVNPNDLSVRLREARRAARLSTLDAARLTGLGERTIRAYENREHLPGVWALAQLPEAYGISLDWLVGRR